MWRRGGCWRGSSSALLLGGTTSRSLSCSGVQRGEASTPLLSAVNSNTPLLLSGNLLVVSKKKFYGTEKKGSVIKATWQILPPAPTAPVTGAAVIDKTAYVIGSNLYTYDVTTGVWSDKIKVKGASIGGRAIAWNANELLFDTQRKLPPKGNPTLNSLNLNTKEAKALGSIPLTNFKLAKSDAPSRVWVVGESYQNTGNNADELPCHIAYWERKGGDVKGEWFAQNLNTLTVTGTAPKEKRELYVTTVKNKLYVFSTSEDQTTIDVHTFDPHKFFWEHIPAAGPVPEPRIGSSISVLGNKVILFGGHSQYLGVFRRHTTEVLSFDTDKNEWETVEAQGEVKGRSEHQAINLGNNELLFVGGKNEFRKMRDSLKLKFQF